MTNLIEICCRCGFVHRDDRQPRPVNKQKKLHYHWLPNNEEVAKNGYIIHATICVSCINDNVVDWKLYSSQRQTTPIKYYLKLSYNAPLPEQYEGVFDELYYTQAKYLQVEI